MRRETQDQWSHHTFTNILYLENVKAELDTIGPLYIDLKRPDCPQEGWPKDNEGTGRGTPKVRNSPLVEAIFWLKILWVGSDLGISKGSNIQKNWKDRGSMSLQRSETVFWREVIKRPCYGQSIVMYLWSPVPLLDLIARATANRSSPLFSHNLLVASIYLSMSL